MRCATPTQNTAKHLLYLACVILRIDYAAHTFVSLDRDYLQCQHAIRVIVE